VVPLCAEVPAELAIPARQFFFKMPLIFSGSSDNVALLMNSNLNLEDLKFDYPEELVAQSPAKPPRVMFASGSDHKEIQWSELFEQFQSGDLLVLNDTRVLKRRVFAEIFEILFLNALDNPLEWEVLFPSKSLKVGSAFELPGGIQAELIEKGRPQKIRTSERLNPEYFLKNAELPLPPYIQKARGFRKTVSDDEQWYQTVWGKNEGSLASPTASLHFDTESIELLKSRGVQVEFLTLHVGLGTFLPLTKEAIEQKKLHEEVIEIPSSTWASVLKAQQSKKTVWALGTTVTRSLEACARGDLSLSQNRYVGSTSLFIQPGFQFKVVSGLMTNFHQPESSLLALVMAFSNKKTVMDVYRSAIEKRFRLFSYGDLSVWIP
jgi:S-adenosylmethionine:tRNA ribosyltransferase-isomerase